ncbi:hypothetical protein HOLleu_29902 [Holothuria leucospilota]|uniref:Uncharacterized protein n=1 Tax=Holothuria leucospilota TaxID=206669 RepID=A0A9Q1BJL0_HOLLE|nr:hypothetical protein HOLleu_29902 [Holothuria leucospilota]
MVVIRLKEHDFGFRTILLQLRPAFFGHTYTEIIITERCPDISLMAHFHLKKRKAPKNKSTYRGLKTMQVRLIMAETSSSAYSDSDRRIACRGDVCRNMIVNARHYM